MNGRNGIRAAWVIEVLGLLVGIAAGVYFVLMGQCQWELILACVWGGILLVLTVLLVRAERQAVQRERDKNAGT